MRKDKLDFIFYILMAFLVILVSCFLSSIQLSGVSSEASSTLTEKGFLLFSFLLIFVFALAFQKERISEVIRHKKKAYVKAELMIGRDNRNKQQTKQKPLSNQRFLHILDTNFGARAYSSTFIPLRICSTERDFGSTLFSTMPTTRVRMPEITK